MTKRQLQQHQDQTTGEIASPPVVDSRFWRSEAEKSLMDSGQAPAPTVENKTIDVEPEALFSRRSFMKASSVAAASAAFAGCIRRPEEKILPYTRAPEHLVPGVPQHFATVTSRGRDALGVVVTSHDGRPTKIEGNREHPASQGASDIQAQAHVWDLYDPSRARQPRQRINNALLETDPGAFTALLRELITKHKSDQGAGLRVLSAVTNSPSLRRMRSALQTLYPKSRWHTYSSVNDDNARQGARIALGTPHAMVPDYEKAYTIVSLDADFLGAEPGAVRAGRGVGARRHLKSPDDEMSRLYIAESNFSVTGSLADHRFRMKSASVIDFAVSLAKAIGSSTTVAIQSGASHGLSASVIQAVADDLLANRGRSLVVAGATQPPEVHALAWAMNQTLANIGNTVMLGPAVDPEDHSGPESLQKLVSEGSQVSTLLILGGNPVYDAPADIDIKALLAR